MNRAQRAAVQTLSGPLLVLAGAGSGKTRVITYRIARLIESGVTPQRILAVTFTNKAAREMKSRAVALLGGRRKRGKPPEISTFHSLCVRILRRHIHVLGYPREFAIYDRGDQESLARAALRDIRVGHETLRPGDLIAMIGGWKNRALRPPDAEQSAVTDKEQLAALAYARYQAALKASGAVDFDDLLLCTQELLENHPEVRFAEATRFDHLLIDEYQDTNGLQYRIVRALAEQHRNICVVGDDDQSIYAWRGAEVSHILNFERDWPGCKVVRLEENYRSRAPILQLANTLIAHNTTRHPKVLRAMRGEGPPPRFLRFEDESREASAIAHEIRQKIDAPGEDRVSPSDIAILFRTNEQPRAFEVELRRERVPYVLVGGLSFYDRKEVRDVLAYLKVLANPADEVSLLRVINTPPRGIGSGTVETLVAQAVAAGKPLWETLPEAIQSGQLGQAIGERVAAFCRLITATRAELGSVPLVDLVTRLLQTIDYKSELERIYKTASEVDARWAAVEELVNAIGSYESRAEQPSLLGFLDEALLEDRDDQKDEDKRQVHAVTLMTLHSAKGLEFPHVYLVGMEEGLLPHQRAVADGLLNGRAGVAIAEERRLCYVGVTRAQHTLSLSFCKARMKWGKLRPSIPSRFLLEMRGETDKARRLVEASEAAFGGLGAAPEDTAAEPKAEQAGARKSKTPPRARRRAAGAAK